MKPVGCNGGCAPCGGGYGSARTASCLGEMKRVQYQRNMGQKILHTFDPLGGRPPCCTMAGGVFPFWPDVALALEG